jgi:hypothetical protein
MSDQFDVNENRRGFLKRVGLGAAALPLVGLAACAKQDAPAPAAAAPPAAEPAAAAPVETAPAEPAAAEPAPTTPAAAEDTSGWPRVDEGEPLATALGYKHDATKIDAARQPRYQAGQICRGCIQWKGNDTQEWGPCAIFPKKLVNANGWCTTYAPKA